LFLIKKIPRPLESAEENSRRLTGKPDLILPFPEADETEKNSHVICPYCAVTTGILYFKGI